MIEGLVKPVIEWVSKRMDVSVCKRKNLKEREYGVVMKNRSRDYERRGSDNCANYHHITFDLMISSAFNSIVCCPP